MNRDPFFFMRKALEIASAKEEEVPVGAVLVQRDQVIAVSGNAVKTLPDPTAHAEIQVLRQGAQILGQSLLPLCDIYVTLEPCPMCAQALSFARIRRIYFGAYDPKGGGIDHGPRLFHQQSCHHSPEIYGGFLEKDCAALLKNFFKTKRTKD